MLLNFSQRTNSYNALSIAVVDVSGSIDCQVMFMLSDGNYKMYGGKFNEGWVLISVSYNGSQARMRIKTA
jgi:hypothetical protein